MLPRSVTPRSASQQLASRTNGARSHGPTSAVGKSISSANAVRSGLEARCVLLPGEDLEDRVAIYKAMTQTFGGRTPAEAMVIARVADCFVRLERLEQLEVTARENGVMHVLQGTPIYKKLDNTTGALTAVRGMADLAEWVHTPQTFEAVQSLAPALRRTLELVESADIPMALLLRLRDILNTIVTPMVIDVPVEEFRDLAVAARGIETYLFASMSAQKEELETEKRKLSRDFTLADEDELRRLDRHRGRITRELEGLLRLLRQIRDLAVPGEGGLGSFVQVELRVVGRALVDGQASTRSSSPRP